MKPNAPGGAFDPLLPFRPRVDPALRTMLNGRGIGDREIACLWRDVNADDMRSVRRIAGIAGGPVSVMGSIMGATIPIAHGIHWNGGSLRMAPGSRTMPETVLDTLTGRPLRDLVDHPLLPDVRIVEHDEDDLKFWANALPPRNHGTVVHTDSEPFVLPEPGTARLKHAVVRAWHDRRAGWEQLARLQLRVIILTIPVLALVYGGMFALGVMRWNTFSLPAMIIGLCSGWGMAVAVILLKGGTTKERWGTAHERFMLAIRERQREQGFIGPEE